MAVKKVQVEKNIRSKKIPVKKELSLRKKSTKDTVVVEVKPVAPKLPGEIFDVKVNMQLITQAIRVQQANARFGHASTKSRGEVEGSTRKIYRQKGTGRARHGAIRAPIFVGGGIVFGPKPRDYSLNMPQETRLQALYGILTLYAKKGKVFVSDILENLEPKTKFIVNLLKDQGLNQSKVLLVVSADNLTVRKSSRNLSYATCVRARDLNAFQVAAHEYVFFSQKALDDIVKAGKI